jgi:hypothetical protein
MAARINQFPAQAEIRHRPASAEFSGFAISQDSISPTASSAVSGL